MTAPACGSCTAPVQDGYLCSGCTRDLAELLLLAASTAADLDDAMALLLKRGTGGRRAKTEAPLPYDPAAATVARELRNCLFLWVGRILTEDMAAPARPDSESAARWLHARVSRLRQLPDAGGIKRDIKQVIDRAEVVTDRQPEKVPAGLCDNCGRQLLAELGADSVTCGCGMTVLALQDKRRERAAAADVLGTPVELSAVLATLGYVIAPGTISGWGTRGQIEKRAGGVYRLSEALTMAAKTGTRRARVAG